jgi:NodT family efflux transporter outer membrane factor (OMF) lipoprotein
MITGPARAFAAAGALSLILTGCTTVGPDFHPPTTTWDEGWTSPALSGIAKSGAEAQDWWRQFNDPALDALIAEADAANPSLKIAGLRVLEARAQLGIAQSGLRPQQIVVNATGGYGASAPGGAALSDFDALFGSAGISGGWEIDFWGRFRRGIESADASYFASEADYDDSLILLRSQVAQLYFAYRTAQERLEIARQNAEFQHRSVEIAQTLFRNGATDELDLLQARTQYLGTQATIPPLETTLQQTRNALTILLGRPPGDLPELALGAAKLPKIPEVLAVSIPADLLRRRPDVRAAAFRAGAQSARIGMAKSDFYPHLSILGAFSLTRTTLGDLSNSTSVGLGPSLSWNIFDFGRIHNNVRVEDARFQQTLEAYQATTLQAAREVDDASIAFAKGREQNVVLDQAQQAARRSLDIALIGYKEGFVDFERVLTSQAALLNQQEQFVANRGDTIVSLTKLYQAVGGGWIGPGPAGYVDAATRAQMKARTDWGDMIDRLIPVMPPAPSARDTKSGSAHD